LSSWYGNWLHEGQMLDPTMRNIEKFLEDTQATVTGKVFVTLQPYRYTITGIESAHDLMSSKFGSYGEMNKGWSGDDVKVLRRSSAISPAFITRSTRQLYECCSIQGKSVEPLFVG